VLADGVDTATINGFEVRKGSVAAFIANVKRLETLSQADAAYDEVLTQIRALVPTLRAVGVFDTFELRSARVAELIENY
jgi:hypothetical protein